MLGKKQKLIFKPSACTVQFQGKLWESPGFERGFEWTGSRGREMNATCDYFKLKGTLSCLENFSYLVVLALEILNLYFLFPKDVI